jgi:hypothetical protein
MNNDDDDDDDKLTFYFVTVSQCCILQYNRTAAGNQAADRNYNWPFHKLC